MVRTGIGGMFMQEYALFPSGLPNPKIKLPPSPHKIRNPQVASV